MPVAVPVSALAADDADDLLHDEEGEDSGQDAQADSQVVDVGLVAIAAVGMAVAGVGMAVIWNDS